MPPLISHPTFCFSCSHIRCRCWRKRIRAPACSGWVCGRTSLPAHSYRMEGEGEPAIQAAQSHICTRWTRLLGGWTSTSLVGCAPGLPGQDARQWGSRSGFSLFQGPMERDRPGSARHQSHCPSHRAFDVQPDSVGVPPLAHNDGDERGGQSPLPRRSDLVRQPVWTSCGGLCWTAGPPRKQPLLYLSPPRLALGAEESVFMDPYGTTIAPRSPTAVIADKIKRIYFQKESKNLFLPTISVLPLCSQSAQLFQPLAMRAEAWQAIPGESTWEMNDYGKTRLYTPIHSKTTTLPRCAHHHSVQRECSGPPRRGDESAGKRSHRNRSSSPKQVRLLQQLHPRPQKRQQSATYSRSQTPELCPDEKVVQDDHFETDPPANMPRGLVHVAGSGAHPSQTILESSIWRGGISIQGPAVWAIPGSPHLFTMHGCGSLPSATDGNPHTLPRRLAHSGPVAGGFNIAQDPLTQPLRLSGAQGQLCQEHTVTQPTSFVPGYSYRLCRWQQLSQQSEPWQFSTTWSPSRKVPPIRSKLSRECWALWQRLRHYFSWVCFTCDPSSSGWSRAFHPRPGVTDATT